jgi:hypothetical protein
MRVAVIGGGPSGLVTLKYLIQASASISCEPVEAILFEYQTQVGGTFAARSYEDAEVSAGMGETMDQATDTHCSSCPPNNSPHSPTSDIPSMVTFSALSSMCSIFKLTARISNCGLICDSTHEFYLSPQESMGATSSRTKQTRPGFHVNGDVMRSLFVRVCM